MVKRSASAASKPAPEQAPELVTVYCVASYTHQDFYYTREDAVKDWFPGVEVISWKCTLKERAALVEGVEPPELSDVERGLVTEIGSIEAQIDSYLKDLASLRALLKERRRFLERVREALSER